MKTSILIILSTFLIMFANNIPEKKYQSNKIPTSMTVEEKKKRFYSLIVPTVKKVQKNLKKQYFDISNNIKNNTNLDKIEKLKFTYKVKTNKQLLYALKPHPNSITIAQAAMESGWATSRFFIQANNIFGVWSINKNEPRIKANKTRHNSKIIWLKKFASIEESIKSYYKLLGRSRAYKKFRTLRFETNNPYEITKGLINYSELKEEYIESINLIIRINNLEKYD